MGHVSESHTGGEGPAGHAWVGGGRVGRDPARVSGAAGVFVCVPSTTAERRSVLSSSSSRVCGSHPFLYLSWSSCLFVTAINLYDETLYLLAFTVSVADGLPVGPSPCDNPEPVPRFTHGCGQLPGRRALVVRGLYMFPPSSHENKP